MRQSMTNVLTLAGKDLKRPDIPQSLGEKGNGKENMFYFGQYLKQEKVFPLLWTKVTQNFFPMERPRGEYKCKREVQ